MNDGLNPANNEQDEEESPEAARLALAEDPEGEHLFMLLRASGGLQQPRWWALPRAP